MPISLKSRSLAVAVATASLLAMTACASSHGGHGTAPKAGGGGSVSGSTVLLGEIGEDSGALAAAVTDAKEAAEAWQAYVNAHGGLNGHPVKILFRDTGGTPAGGLQAAKELVESDHVVAMFGMHTNVALPTILPYLQKKNIPVIGVLDGVPANVSPGIYTPTQGPHDQPGLFAKAIPQIFRPDKKIAVIYCSESPSCISINKGFTSAAPKYGLTTVYSGEASTAAPDYTAQILAAKNAGAQAVLVVEGSAALIHIMQDMTQQGWKPDVLSTPNVAESGTSLTGVPSDLKLATLTNGEAVWNTADAAAAAKTYVTAVKTYVPGGTFGNNGEDTWAAGVLLQEASRSFGATVTSADIVNGILALHSTTLGGLTPPLSFSSSHGDVNHCAAAEIYQAGQWKPAGSGFLCLP